MILLPRKFADRYPLVRATLRDLRESVNRGFAITQRNLLRLHQRRMAEVGLSSIDDVGQVQLMYLRNRYADVVRRRR